ncbi:MAG: zinc ribbon domain-containing protein [Candidatus Omnitrophica bacterium]|nr:zinc ribbon domain-containing protein [Candidatus Omnitrophota bacterium]
MPTYEYLCDACGHRFERFQPITARPVRSCPKCRRRVKRLIHGGAGLIFKGSGFYQTDHRSKSYREAAQKEKPEKKSEAAAPCGTSPCKQPDVCFPDKK